MRVWLLLIFAGLLFGCNSSDDTIAEEDDQPVAVAPGITLLRSALSYQLTPAASDGQLQQLVQDNNQFALQLYQQQISADNNLFFSPHSISTAMAMLYAGAAGQTATEMAAALQFTQMPAQLHQTFNAYALKLKQEIADHQAPFALYSNNAAFVEKSFVVKPGYLDLLARHYDSGLYTADFKVQAALARQQINQWVAQLTNNRISQILPDGSVNSDTALVLVNTIYFKARWYQVFTAANTANASFTLLDGTERQVPLMYQSQMRLPYHQGSGYTAISLPYENPALEMLILVPETGNFTEFEASIDAAAIADIRALMQDRLVDLHLPKFTLATQFPLKAALQQLGMQEAFSPGSANFSAISDTNQLFVDNAMHQAVISVDETGTEAAAATSAVIGVISSPEYAALRIDRPFIFMIRQQSTGAILFMGRVTQP
ncbi:serpin family protein [Arsukibacterium indicum]|uniref:Serpin family protein n=1 Tax=Arsukibacterium indicum TaxID=2848612 RepID=A0ABS6MKC2_9GAMM|nr:serpin family protein [Arsukibacterium indicum]MBV2129271.1 serpin family protein [Arsukibacterium indicum]